MKLSSTKEFQFYKLYTKALRKGAAIILGNSIRAASLTPTMTLKFSITILSLPMSQTFQKLYVKSETKKVLDIILFRKCGILNDKLYLF